MARRVRESSPHKHSSIKDADIFAEIIIGSAAERLGQGLLRAFKGW
jgi:hypothetical protein